MVQIKSRLMTVRCNQMGPRGQAFFFFWLFFFFFFAPCTQLLISRLLWGLISD